VTSPLTQAVQAQDRSNKRVFAFLLGDPQGFELAERDPSRLPEHLQQQADMITKYNIWPVCDWPGSPRRG
jgi:hypothetical protein